MQRTSSRPREAKTAGAVILATLVLVVVTVAIVVVLRRSKLDSVKKEDFMSFPLKSPAFEPGQRIPKRYTGDGEDVSPALHWSGVPDGTQEFALVCDDPDAPTDEPWVHWVIYGIPGETRELPEGVPPDKQLTSPITAFQGKNSWSDGQTIGYRGPAPPRGHGTHHYHFKLYALDTKLSLGPGATKAELLRAMSDHVLAEGELIGTYER